MINLIIDEKEVQVEEVLEEMMIMMIKKTKMIHLVTLKLQVFLLG